MEAEYIVVLITVPSIDVGEEIAVTLLESKQVACVNIIPMSASIYWWQGEIQNEQEALLIAKSRAELFEDGIIPTVQAVHPYDVPEIVALPILMGSREYLDWIDEETRDEL